MRPTNPKLAFRHLVMLLAAALALAFSSGSANAQVLYGSLVGNVTDQNGAVVPDARVTITNKGTGQTREAATNSSGEYSINNILPGVYDIKITKQGFNTARPVITEHIDPRGKLYYWIGELREGFRADGGTDFEAIDEGYVSVTPMRSDLTNHAAIGALQDWNRT